MLLLLFFGFCSRCLLDFIVVVVVVCWILSSLLFIGFRRRCLLDFVIGVVCWISWLLFLVVFILSYVMIVFSHSGVFSIIYYLLLLFMAADFLFLKGKMPTTGLP